ncbi:Tryptophan synthase alpha chain [Candidatus Syntrophocurvum alkaliphilum]|uniref:Tryptophan synthase alpha chain n=1 Tax=Candidatus Syntrophocurvum alkaliphilum TaxID=2293317 RepID=A0A6I6DBJ2_9FIRM|nr:tryptophan synthase subunit alpha [Candidatus Syntrophocurvum alkaliphilum]QGU00089.1 Tryptophan synthase alpha chain [Candidatus Syntrophocurvum alkaliphilum]
MSIIKDKFKELKNKGEMGLIAFMMSAIPNEDLCLDCIKALEQGGCDLLELGVPFTDPVADGKVLERFHHQGVNNGLDLDRCLDFIDKVKNSTNIPIILFSYLNPIYKKGIDKCMSELKDIGINNVIVPDLPLDELSRLEGFGVEVIPMLAPSSRKDRMELVGKRNADFIYCVSSRGTTGVKSLEEEEIKQYLSNVNMYTDSPLALGFGISQPKQAKQFKNLADAIVIGSHFANLIERNNKKNTLPAIIENETISFKQALI